jgi:hypothetical protein
VSGHSRESRRTKGRKGIGEEEEMEEEQEMSKKRRNRRI